jgi:hypothetical protein
MAKAGLGLHRRCRPSRPRPPGCTRRTKNGATKPCDGWGGGHVFIQHRNLTLGDRSGRGYQDEGKKISLDICLYGNVM